jgi:hypothetical protein
VDVGILLNHLNLVSISLLLLYYSAFIFPYYKFYYKEFSCIGYLIDSKRKDFQLLALSFLWVKGVAQGLRLGLWGDLLGMLG